MKIPRWIVSLFYVAFVAWSLYGAVVPVETYLFRMVHMGFIFVLSFLVFPFSKSSGRWLLWLDLLLAALGAAAIAYALLDMDEFIRRSTVPEQAIPTRKGYPTLFCWGQAMLGPGLR